MRRCPYRLVAAEGTELAYELDSPLTADFREKKDWAYWFLTCPVLSLWQRSRCQSLATAYSPLPIKNQICSAKRACLRSCQEKWLSSTKGGLGLGGIPRCGLNAVTLRPRPSVSDVTGNLMWLLVTAFRLHRGIPPLEMRTSLTRIDFCLIER